MDILRVAGIETVLVCGLITSVCVQHSAFGIFEAGYRTLLVTDACADRGRARHEAALALYGDYMYELVTSQHLESKQYGLIPAKPVWLILDSKTKMVRANSFPYQAESAAYVEAEDSHARSYAAGVAPPAPVVLQASPVDALNHHKSSNKSLVTKMNFASSTASTASTTTSTSNDEDDEVDNDGVDQNARSMTKENCSSANFIHVQ